MKRKLLAALMLVAFAFAVSASAQESISKRKTCEMSAASDDAEENLATGEMYFDQQLELCYHQYLNGSGRYQITGLRFPTFGLPVNVIIDSAYLQFFSMAEGDSPSNLTIRGEASVDSAPFTSAAHNISSRPKTSASTLWAAPEWTGWGEQGLAQRSSDVSAIVKEIVAQNGFTSESPITLFLQGEGTRIAYPFDNDPFRAPKLIINYHLPNGTSNTAPYRDRYSNFFPLGTSLSSSGLGQLSSLGEYNIFKQLTAEYEMKWDTVQPQYNSFAFDKADLIANYARNNTIKMSGHTFVGRNSNPDWLFQDGPDGAISPAILSSRLMNHIDKMVQRYGDVVDNWDVVNEAISDSSDPNKIYKDESEGSQWWGVFGSPEFIKLAFQYTAEANARYGRNSLLFYSDSGASDPEKLDKMLAMVDYLRANNQQIDGIGIHGHWILNKLPISQIKAAFDKIIAKGLLIKISELDMSIWNIHYNDENPDYQPPLTEEAKQEQAYYYQELFDLFREYKDHIHNVTFWGISDNNSWLNYDWNTWDLLPVGQRDAPLLFDENSTPKSAFYSIMDFDSGTSSNQPPTAVLSLDVTSGNAPLTVAFDGSQSSDADGSIVEYSWNFGDGSSAAGASASVSHVYQAAGSYTAQLTVRDNFGSTGTASAAVTVEPNPSYVVHVHNIAMSVVSVNKNKNAAQAIVTVQNTLGDPIEGVTVAGAWSGIVSGSISGATDSNGAVTFSSNTTRKTGTVTFTVNDLSKTDYQYDSGSNLMTSASVTIK